MNKQELAQEKMLCKSLVCQFLKGLVYSPVGDVHVS